jgi:probable HAF family extracellular repeat protein
MGRLGRMRDRSVRIVVGTAVAGIAALVPLAPTAATASTETPGPVPGLGPVDVDVPGADQTGAFAISDRGRIVGLYGSAPATNAMGDAVQGVGHGTDRPTARSQFPAFVAAGGRYRSFEAPDPDVQLGPFGITNRGEIVGEYITPTREIGFRRDTRSRIATIDLPGTAGTQVDKVNDRGQIVGCYSKTSPFLPAGPGTRGYVLDRGKVTRIDVPRAVSTVPHGINERGHVVGVYEDTAGLDHGFRWRHGQFTTFDVPGAVHTEALDINSRGDVVGIYGGGDGTIHGFMLRDGVYTTIDAPGATQTLPSAINDRGHVVVSALAPTAADPFAGARGFVLRKGVDGPFEEVRFPGAPRTIATGIDDRGRIIGIYENPNFEPDVPGDRVQPKDPPPELPPGLEMQKESR